jgi:Tfp pilus assembly protein PilF
MPEDDVDGQLELAGAWVHLARGNLSYDETAKKAVTRANRSLDAHAETSSHQWLQLATLQEFLDATAAVDSYRHVLQIESNQPIAQNNLAMLMCKHGNDLAEAERLAGAASANIGHPSRPSFLDTLSTVRAKLGDFDGAVKALNAAVQLEPANLKWRVNLVQLLVDSQRFTQARENLDEIDKLTRASGNGDEGTVSKLDAAMQTRIQALRENTK